jgi:NAD(P)-dependent dehydrogenase (short-subunit alcohol dehydrogenase family)
MNVLITGAGRGIGRSLALAFGKAGHNVTLNYGHSRADAERLAEEIGRLGVKSMAIQADVSDPTQASGLVEKSVDHFGMLDVLINNAGIARDRTILKMSVEEWREVLDVNLNGAFWCLQAAGRHMTKQKRGHIINISSLVGYRGGVGNANYAASKAGLMALTKAAAREFGRFQVCVNAVLPGFHPTQMSQEVWEKRRDLILAEHVLGNLVDVDELADFIVNLSAKKSVSGQVFAFESRIL